MSTWKQEVSKIILEILECRVPSQQVFTSDDIDKYLPRLEAIFGKKNKNIKNTALKTLQLLRDHDEAIEFVDNQGTYRLTPNGKSVLQNLTKP